MGLHLDCGGKVLRDAAFSLRIGNQSGVAEYLAAALQMTPLQVHTVFE